MTMFDIIKFLLEVSAILLGCYLIYREKDLIKFEKKVWKYAKAFVKACAYTLRDKICGVEEVKEPVTLITNDEYEEMLKTLNRSSNVTDIRIAS